MKIKIIYKVGGVSFEAVLETIADAYEYIKAVINANEVMFPRKAETLSEYMGILTDFMRKGTLKHENYLFAIESV